MSDLAVAERFVRERRSWPWWQRALYALVQLIRKAQYNPIRRWVATSIAGGNILTCEVTMQVTVTYLGLPVVAVDAGVARTPAGAIALGFGVRLGGYAAYRASGRTATEALELHDARGELIPTTALRLAPTPFGRRVVLFAHLRDALAGVPARLGARARAGTAAARRRPGAGANTEPPVRPPHGATEGSSAPAT